MRDDKTAFFYIVVFAIAFALALIFTSSQKQNLQEKYDVLEEQYFELEDKYDRLSTKYYDLLDTYEN